jgi:glucokinase
MQDLVIGIDIGGTVVRVGAIDIQGELLALRESPIEARRGPQAGLERIAGMIEEVLRDRSIEGAAQTTSLRGIGIGCTGPVDPVQGVVNNPYTLPTWENVPLRTWLEERFSVPARLENDADVAALGEYWKGAGKGVKRLYAVTVGTGIGTALIVDGQIYRGIDGCHPEGGHQVIDASGPLCYCGAHGCWESLASGSAIVRMARQAVKAVNNLEGEYKNGQTQVKVSAMRESPLRNLDADHINARLVADLAQKGDSLAMKVIEEAAYYFSLGVANVVLLFTPDLIVLSGGVMRSAELFMPTLQEAMQRHNVMVPADKVHIRQAQLGTNAGVVGAAYTIVQRL